MKEGAIGDLNYAEGFWARHSPTGAWQYPIPSDASPANVDWETFISNTTKRSFDATRFFRWRNYTDYGTGMAGDCLYIFFPVFILSPTPLDPIKFIHLAV